MKKTVKLTEKKLNSLITESVRKALKEHVGPLEDEMPRGGFQIGDKVKLNTKKGVFVGTIYKLYWDERNNRDGCDVRGFDENGNTKLIMFCPLSEVEKLNK